jgi:hypothetical protein
VVWLLREATDIVTIVDPYTYLLKKLGFAFINYLFIYSFVNYLLCPFRIPFEFYIFKIGERHPSESSVVHPIMTFGAKRDLFSIYAGHGFTKGVQLCIDSFDVL